MEKPKNIGKIVETLIKKKVCCWLGKGLRKRVSQGGVCACGCKREFKFRGCKKSCLAPERTLVWNSSSGK